MTVQTTVGGITYDVTTFTGSYVNNTTKFNTLANSGLMPWWGSLSLASTFASQISTQLGLPNGSVGPNFAYQTQENFGDIYVDSRAYIQAYQAEDQSSNLDSTSATYATATPVPAAAAAPGPLPIFGAAAAFGMSRRLRHRILLNG